MSDNTQRESAALAPSEAPENPEVPDAVDDTSMEEAAEDATAAVDEPAAESATEPAAESAAEPADQSVTEPEPDPESEPATEPDKGPLIEPFTDTGADSAEETAAEQGGVPMTARQDQTQEQSQEQASAVQATKSARKAHLAVSRVEPWSVMKFSFVIALVCFIVLFVAVAVIYAILSTLGVFDAVTDLISSLTEGGEEEEIALNPESWFSPARVLGYTGLIGALNIILITALSTVGAMLYNLAADLVGGVDVTLTESE